VAAFEREPEESVVNNEVQILNDVFGDRPICYVIIAEDVSSSEPVGMLLFYIAYSTWKGKYIYVEDLFVKDPFRNLGIGRRLLRCAIMIGYLWGCLRLSWQVLDWNEGAISFYKSLGAKLHPDWIPVRLDRDGMSAIFGPC